VLEAFHGDATKNASIARGVVYGTNELLGLFSAFGVVLGGAMFSIQVGLASPSLVGIVPSIEMVIYAAVGGRLSLIGAVYGAVLVGSAKTFFSENFVEYWMYFIGGLFVFTVMFLPDGLGGLIDRIRGRRQLTALPAKAPEPEARAVAQVEPAK